MNFQIHVHSIYYGVTLAPVGYSTSPYMSGRLFFNIEVKKLHNYIKKYVFEVLMSSRKIRIYFHTDLRHFPTESSCFDNGFHLSDRN